MADIRINFSFPNHRKTKKLVALGGEGMVRHLLKLWCYAAEHKQNGTLSNMDDLDITLAADYDGDDFVRKVIDAGFIDDVFPRKLHDWKDHQGWVVKAPKRKAHAKKMAIKSWESRRKTTKQPPATSKANSKEKTSYKQCSSPLPSSPYLTLPYPSLNTEEPPFDKIIADLNLVTKRTGQQLLKLGDQMSKGTISNIRARFKDGYKLEDFKHVHRVKVQEWTGTDQEVYLTPETLYRPTKFPKYAAQQFPTEKQTLLNKHGEATLAAGKRVLEEMACKSKTDLKLLE